MNAIDVARLDIGQVNAQWKDRRSYHSVDNSSKLALEEGKALADIKAKRKEAATAVVSEALE